MWLLYVSCAWVAGIFLGSKASLLNEIIIDLSRKLYVVFGLVTHSISPLITPILRDLSISYSQMGLSWAPGTFEHRSYQGLPDYFFSFKKYQ